MGEIQDELLLDGGDERQFIKWRLCIACSSHEEPHQPVSQAMHSLRAEESGRVIDPKQKLLPWHHHHDQWIVG